MKVDHIYLERLFRDIARTGDTQAACSVNEGDEETKGMMSEIEKVGTIEKASVVNFSFIDFKSYVSQMMREREKEEEQTSKGSNVQWSNKNRSV